MRTGFQAYVRNSADAVEFYLKAFSATLGYHVRNEDGSYLHAEIYLDDQLLLAVSESSSDLGQESMKRFTPQDYPTMNFGVNLGSEEAVRKAYARLMDGGNILLPIGPLPWSSCCANVIDRFGIFWYISV